jgi:extracellular elastinolytic metalloproteinase
MFVEEVKNQINADPEFKVMNVPFSVNKEARVAINYLQVDDGKGGLKLQEVYDVQVELQENWYHAHIDSISGKVLQLLDWVSDAVPENYHSSERGARYEVYPIGTNDPESGKREIVENPADKDASPKGWHDDGKNTFTVTSGNNVQAQANWGGQLSFKKNEADDDVPMQPDGGKSLSFLFPIDLKKDPKDYVNAAVTNLFYWNNIIHDLWYKYGFNEVSGNFQSDNFGRGGKGNDAVIANAQDGSGLNNANFATPPDGQPGKMRMYIWDQSQPRRDGDLVAGIIVHEYAHGITTRLTGGPANSGCLGWGEAGGMGEGWGDFFATILKMKPEYTREKDFAMGAYAMNNDKGIRNYVYSTNMKTNPSTYAFIKKFSYIGVHAKGEVWAEILYEVYWDLVDKHGFNGDWFNTSAKGKENSELPAGNIIAFQLVVDGLKNQPCRPTFVDARDAIIQADEVNYNGANVCLLWKAFARRGLGFKAKAGGNEDFSVAPECD